MTQARPTTAARHTILVRRMTLVARMTAVEVRSTPAASNVVENLLIAGATLVVMALIAVAMLVFPDLFMNMDYMDGT